MRFISRTMLAGGCVGLLALSIPAFATPLPQPREPHTRAQPPRGVNPAQAKPAKPQRHIAQRPLVQKPAQARIALASVAPPRPDVKKPLFGWPGLVDEARKYMGTNPTKRGRLWCATFMNMVLAKAGYTGTNSDAAKSFSSYGRRISEPKVGAIAVLTRGKRGGHVGVVSGVDNNGNPIIISGNHNKLVGESVYPRSRVIAYVMPTDSRPSTATTLVADRGPPNMSRVGSEPGIDSPIAELMAAIEKERGERTRETPPVRVAAQPQQPQVQPPAPARVIEQLSAAPHRVVQQTPEPPRASSWRDQSLSDFLGIKARARM